MEENKLEIDFCEFSKESACYIIEPSDIPNIDLYMDQVTTFMETKLSGYKRNDKDKILTKTMINNYAKAKLFPSPIKKKYTKNHVMLLIIIYHLKNMLSINDIGTLIAPVSKELAENPESKILEKIYSIFVLMQKAVYGSADKRQGFDSEFFGKYIDDDEIKGKKEYVSVVYVLGFSIFSNMEKRLSEKIIDSI